MQRAKPGPRGRTVICNWTVTILLCSVMNVLAQITERSVRSPKTPLLRDQELSAPQRLFNHLFNNYKRELRPVVNDSTVVNVTMHLWFKQVLKVDEIDQILTIYCWVEEYWNDEYLRWDPKEFNGITSLNVPTDQIWRPDILVYNNADINVKENEVTTNAVLNHTGDIICFRAIITKVTCNLEMKYFPFDQQTCQMMFASWSYDGSKVFVMPTEARGNLQYYIENTEWKLLDFFFIRNIKYYDCCAEPYPDVTYSFVLERNPSYYILNLIIPSVFITVVTMVGFFTPYSSTGENTEKVSLGVTALLSLAIILLMVADKMPATSKVIPLIGKYYIGLIWLIFAATIITTVTLRLQSKGNAGKPLSKEVRWFFFDWVAKILCMRLDLPIEKTVKFCAAAAAGFSTSASCNGRLPPVQVESTTLLLQPYPGTRSYNYNSGESLPSEYENSINSPCESRGCRQPSPAVDSCFRSRSEYLNSSSSNREALPEKSHIVYCCKFVDCHELQPNRQRCMAVSEVIELLSKIRQTLKDIEQRMAGEAKLVSVRKEWEQLARVCERLLMFIFVVITVVFAVLMLNAHSQEGVVVKF